MTFSIIAVNFFFYNKLKMFHYQKFLDIIKYRSATKVILKIIKHLVSTKKVICKCNFEVCLWFYLLFIYLSIGRIV